MGWKLVKWSEEDGGAKSILQSKGLLSAFCSSTYFTSLISHDLTLLCIVTQRLKPTMRWLKGSRWSHAQPNSAALELQSQPGHEVSLDPSMEWGLSVSKCLCVCVCVCVYVCMSLPIWYIPEVRKTANHLITPKYHYVSSRKSGLAQWWFDANFDLKVFRPVPLLQH